MKKLLITLACLIGFTPSLYAEDVLYCTAELATGFEKENDQWKIGDFDEQRYVVQTSGIGNQIYDDLNNETVSMVHIKSKELEMVLGCKQTFFTDNLLGFKLETNSGIAYWCGTDWQFFIFSADLTRFTYAYLNPLYLKEQEDEEFHLDRGDAASRLVVGTCEKF
jgi:hypothetical protein